MSNLEKNVFLEFSAERCVIKWGGGGVIIVNSGWVELIQMFLKVEGGGVKNLKNTK